MFWKDVFKDKCCNLVFPQKSRNFLQSNPFVLGIASLHDNQMHSSFPLQASGWACQPSRTPSMCPIETRKWSNWSEFDFPNTSCLHVRSIRATYKYKYLQDLSLSPRLPNSCFLTKSSLLDVLFSYCCTILKAWGNYAANSLKSFVAFSDHVNPVLCSQWGAKMVNILPQRN